MPEYPNRVCMPLRLWPALLSIDLHEDQESFKGLIMHSAEYKGSFQWKGKRGVVVGPANTGIPRYMISLRELMQPGHDVAEGMVAAGLSPVTMIQRGNTCASPQYLNHTCRKLNKYRRPPTEYYKKTADSISPSLPSSPLPFAFKH
jgi:hypothetical protein